MNKALKTKVIADSYNSWLIIENDKELCSHSLSMMEGVSGFCSLSYREEEESFYINISKYLNLRELLEYQINEETLLNLALQSVEIRIEAIKFLLPTEGIVYDLDLCYFEPESKSLHMVFLPNRETSGEADFIRWLRELIELSSVKDSREELKSLLRYLNSEDFTLINLKQRLILALESRAGNRGCFDIKFHGGTDLSGQVSKSGNCPEALYRPRKQTIRDYSNLSMEEESYPKPHPEDRQKAVKPLEDISSHHHRVALSKKETKEDRGDLSPKKLRRLALILSQTALVLTYLACCFYLKNIVEPFYKLALGLFLFFALIDYVVLKNLYLNGYFMNRKSEGGREEIKKAEAEQPQKRQKNKIGPKKDDITADSNRTMYLGDSHLKRAALVNKENGEITIINKRDYKIGRQGYDADLGLDDRSVGRLHAFIREEGEHYYLIDNNSVNGTFVNGIRINPGEYNEIIGGDELIFSRLLFQFSTLDN